MRRRKNYPCWTISPPFPRRSSSIARASSARSTRDFPDPPRAITTPSSWTRCKPLWTHCSRRLEMPSFDVVSEIDTHELTNAVDQAVRELGQRFDFKGTDARFELEETTVIMIAPADFQLKQMLEILKLKIAKRSIDVACLEVKDPEINLARAKQLAILKHGIDAETGRKVSRLLKDSKLKVQAQIQGEKVRVIGKKRDDLQEAIAFLRKAELGVPLQFNNFRD